jgi:uncharacterized protein (DUF2345 family)
LLRQAAALADTFHAAATTHQTIGVTAPLKATLESATGATDPFINFTAQDGFAAHAGQSLQLANGETVALASGQNTQFFTGDQMRIQTGLVIGVLGGAVKTGEGGLGLQFIAAKDPVDIQAQHDELTVQARNEVNVVSANAHIDWAAAKRISLSTAGGANITIEGGNVMVQCPGKIRIHAGKKTFSGASNVHLTLPELPRGTLGFNEKFQLLDPSGDPLSNVRYLITKEGGGKIEGVTDANGMISLQQSFSPERLRISVLGRIRNDK